jgi:hypothetical protein
MVAAQANQNQLMKSRSDGVGEILVKVESQYERTQFPRAVAGGRH